MILVEFAFCVSKDKKTILLWGFIWAIKTVEMW